MLSHVGGIIWIISNPDQYYAMVEEASVDMDSFEIIAFMTYIAYGAFAYYSIIV